MRLPKNHVKMSLIISGVVVSALVFVSLLKIITPNTFADNAASLAPSGDIHYVTIYDQGKKLTIKTDAITVADALSRAHFEIATTDIVEPGLTTLINDGNFHINIYRSRPVIVSDGTTKKRLETASYDPITIARDAGFSVYDGDEVNMVANTNFLELQAQLEGTENRISVERRNFNEIAKSYNTSIRKFPRNLLAGMFGFEKRPYFEAQKGMENAPVVQF